jgi:hypothetical protein
MDTLVILAQAADGAGRVGSGMIQGGWSYVWASYAIAYGTMAAYALSLWRRTKAHQGPDEKEPR